MNRKALVADGSSARGAELAGGLRARGWEPILTRDAMLAFAAALKQRPALIVLRDQLAGGGAPAAVAKLRMSVHTAGAHIVVVGREAGRNEQDILASGAQASLPADAPVGAVVAAADAALGERAPPLEAPHDVLAHPERLAAVARYAGAKVGPDSLLHELTRLAATLLGTRSSFLTLVSSDRQTFLTQNGAAPGAGRETPLSHSFCQWVVSSREPVLVSDARAHEVLHANGAVESLGVVAYAGVPISAGEDHTLGSFCASDPEPREWSADDLLIMKSLARMVEAALVASVPRASTPGREFVVMGQGISAAGSLLRRVQRDRPDAVADVLRFLERQSQEVMVQSLGFGGAAGPAP